MINLKNFILALCLPLFLSIFCTSGLAQLSVRTLSLARYGELPRSDSDSNPSYYSDVTIEYRYKWLLAGLRGEGFNSPEANLRFGGDAKYGHISQRYAELFWSWGSARAGNLYGILGKGLIMRAFELPGFVYESRVFRKQHRVIRDIDGLKFSLTPGPLSLTGFGGSIIDPLKPPDENRDLGDLVGGQASLALPALLSLGLAYVEHETGSFRAKLSSYFLAWSADDLLERIGAGALTFDFYAEYATDQSFGQVAAFNKNTPHALYLASNFTWNTFGGSFEYKDYQDFNFGINDPPPLIRENAEVLLNRATHVLDAASERGFQLEFFYSPFALSRIIANYSRARDDRREDVQPLFIERYLGVEYSGDPWGLRFFLDTGQDELFSETGRFTAGIAPDYSRTDGTTIGLNIQWQRFKRLDNRIKNFHATFSIQNWRKFSFAFSGERSNDPNETDDLAAKAIKYFINGSIGWHPTPQMDLQLFLGKRRGGTACDHGFCIEVLDFEGMELRLETRW